MNLHVKNYLYAKNLFDLVGWTKDNIILHRLFQGKKSEKNILSVKDSNPCHVNN